MKIISWNVNGIRACYKKGLDGFVRTEKPDILCLQETKAHPGQVGLEVRELAGMSGEWASATKKGYSGVATFWLQKPKEIRVGLGHEPFDSEGRTVITDHDDFLLYNIYFPNGQRGLDRQEYKMAFHRYLQGQLSELIKRGRQVVVVGDYNIAPTEMDIYDPNKFSTTSGFLPHEREWFSEFFKMGFVDTFRRFYPEERERYTWWNQIDRSRLSNRGWRIDFICVTQGLEKRLKAADILDSVQGSDHCPVMVELS